MKTFIGWMGGKQALAPIILSYFPTDYKKYIEVFGGGASVLFAKKPTENFEVYNDFNANLVNLFQVVRDKPLAFLEALHLFPLNSRQEFYEVRNLVKGKLHLNDYFKEELKIAQVNLEESDFEEIKEILQTRSANRDVQRAVTYFKMIRYSYGNQGRTFACKPINLATTLQTVMKCSERLKKVIIEQKDFEELIQIYDRTDSFFYLDPPYFGAEARYEVQFKGDHERLRECLGNLKGRFLLSYNDCPQIRELYQGFSIVPITRMNTLVFRHGKSEYKEVLIANYDLEETKNQYEQKGLFQVTL